MNQDFEIYKFSIDNIESMLKSVILCQNKCMESVDKNDIEKYNLLINNKKILDEINENIINLKRSFNDISVNASLKDEIESLDIDKATSNLNTVISDECSKIYDVANETREILNATLYEHNDILDSELDNIIKMTEEVENMVKGIIFSDNTNNMVNIVIKDKVNEAKDTIFIIRQEAKNIKKIKYNELNEDVILSFCDFLKININKCKESINNLNTISVNNESIFTKSEEVSINLLKNIIEQEVDVLQCSFNKLKEVVNYHDVMEENFVENNIDEASERLEAYFSKIGDIVSDFNNKDISNDEVINRLVTLYEKEHKDTEEARKKLENELYSNSIDSKQKELDTIEYKKFCSILNKSFWEARQRASLEDIKYPSALYEKMVKEYQNEFLIENCNVSLEGVENYIEEYKIKYAGDIYMDEIYEKAILILKDETTLSIQEMGDESAGLSLLDKKAYELLQEDLTDIIREIGIVKIEENLEDSISLAEYKKSAKLNDLIDKKEIIEKQIYIISKRAEKLESKAG